MSEQNNRSDGNLVPAAGRDLAVVAGANSLVSRGLADLTQGFLLRVSEAVRADNKDAWFFIRCGFDCLSQDYDEAIKNYDEAIKNFNEAIRVDPNCAWAFFFRGRMWREKKENDRAIEDFDEAILLYPQNALFFHDRGCARNAKGDYDNAIKDFDVAIRLKPKHAPVFYCDRAVAWSGKNQSDKAITDYEKAIQGFERGIRLDPEYVFLYASYAWLLATCPESKIRDGKRAIQMATKAYELTEWKSGWELNTLAAAYAEAGQFDEAVRYQTKALEEPDVRGPARDDFRQRLELYTQGKPYRQSP
jgi:tetratricopeptide (TPR) repeat protein